MEKFFFCAVSNLLFIFGPNNKTLVKQKVFNWKVKLRASLRNKSKSKYIS